MSGAVVRLVLEYPWRDSARCTADTLRLVAITLADSARHDGTDARPGLRAAARRSGRHTNTVRRALDELERLGLVSVARPSDHRHPAVYTLAVDNLAARGEVRASDARTSPESTRALERASDARTVRASGRAQDVLTSVHPADEYTGPTDAGRALIAQARAALDERPAGRWRRRTSIPARNLAVTLPQDRRNGTRQGEDSAEGSIGAVRAV